MVFEGRLETAGAKKIGATINVDPHAEVPLSKDLTCTVNVIAPIVTPNLTRNLFDRSKSELLLLTLDQGQFKLNKLLSLLI
ncbi:unnamed protein product [Rodentolepis nana]|uniref:Riboflavin synthase n=1 Tax=Rodentolepis nana TaxID=102285 RepID=A0A0R3TI13_RODNA|nr:unnamed protein product [Rodentolepis nana]